MSISFKNAWGTTEKALKKFAGDDPMSHSSIIAFYTIFSLPAVLIIIIRIAGLAFGEEAVTGELYNQIKGLIGPKSAEQIQDIIRHTSQSEKGALATTIGIATLVFSATTVFISVQNALNAVWGVKAKPEKGWLKFIVNRILSFAMVVSFGFLLLVSLSVEALLTIFNEVLKALLADYAAYLLQGISIVVSLAVNLLLFGLIFKVLPDAKIRWGDMWAGAFITTVLFAVGKYLIGFYLGNSDVASAYGAAGSFVLLLLWVYYSSIILILGAEFTQVIAQQRGRGIQPAEHAVKVIIKEIEKD
jgi:Predicted membrane protein